MLKKLLALTLSSAVLAATLAGCGGTKTSSSASSTGSSNQPVTIQFWTISLKPTFNDYLNGVIKNYETAHPNVKVDWTDLPYGSIQDKLLNSIAAGEAPDVVNMNSQMAVLMASKGGLLNIDQATTPEQRSVYFDKLYKSASVKGAVYALPWYASGHTMYMNTDIITKAGLDPKNPPKTWDELATWAKTIKEKTGSYAIIPDGGANLLFENGVPILSEDKKKAAFNTPDGVSVITWYANLFKDGVAPQDFLAKDFTGALNMYMGGKLAFVLTGPQFLTQVQKQSPDIYKVTDVAPYPHGKSNVDIIPLMNVVVPKLSKHTKEAVDFSLFVTNDENQLAFDKLVAILPSTKKAAADPYFTDAGNTIEGKAKVMVAKQLQTGVDMELGIGPAEQDVFKALSDAFGAAASGTKSPEQALKDAEATVNKVLSQQQ